MKDATAEFRALGSFIDHPDMVLRATNLMFTDERITLYEAMKECVVAYGKVTHEGLERFYTRPIPPQLEAARGADPAPIMDRLADLATKRELAKVSLEIEKLIAQQYIDTREISQALHFRPITAQQDTGLETGLQSFAAELNRKLRGEYRFASTGLSFLDYMLGDEWPRQAITIIIGQPGGGKTGLVCDSMLKMANLEDPRKSLFISLEMPKKKIVARLLANHTRIDGLRIRKGEITEEEVKRLDRGMEEIARLPIYINDGRGLTVDDIILQVREHKELYNIDVVFVDYLQLVSHTGDSEHEELGRITQRLRDTAKELDIAVVILAQQNRAYTGIQSISGSGKVGQNADVVVEIKMVTDDEDQRLVSFDFHKNRDGPVGSQTCLYEPKFMTFSRG